MARNQNGDWLRYENPDEKLPWLEPADGYAEQPRPIKGKLIGGLIAVIAVIFLLVAGMTWLLNRETAPGAEGEAGLIRAPSGPYKHEPDDPGGMYVEGQGDAVYAAGAGVDPGGTIDLTRVAEEPIARATAGVEAGDVAIANLPASAPNEAAPAAKTVAPQENVKVASQPVKVAEKANVPPNTSAAPAVQERAKAQASVTTRLPQATAVEPSAPPAASKTVEAAKPAELAASRTGNGSYGLQLGAFSSRATADSAWKSLSGRFVFLGALDKSIEQIEVSGKKLYRLRAVGIVGRSSADNLCGRLKVAGDACTVVNP